MSPRDCKYPNCDGGPATGYCHSKCRTILFDTRGTDIPARRAMLTVDVIKMAYRQDKEGFVVAFRLHPQDEHLELANAPLGSQWQLHLVPLNEDGNPDTGEGWTAHSAPSSWGPETDRENNDPSGPQS